MDVFMTVFVEYLAELLAVAAVSLIGYYGSKLLSKMREQEGLENISIATEQVLSAVQATVLELQQTFVEDWKKAQNGKLTEEQINTLRDKVIEITSAKLSKPTLDLLASAKVDIIVLITSTAEAYILQMKSGD